ncbi:MAG: Lrp/AsnC family transcriptional regulator [Candidatus Nanohaloarchaea archaeon]
MEETVDIDDLDREILNTLMTEGRKSFRQIAEDVDSTPATVINRVERLQEEGVIRGYAADIDYRELGYEGIAAIEVILQGDDLSAVTEEIEQHDNVVTAYTITGDTDALLLVKFPDRASLTEFVQSFL